jgi:transposase-like protein
MQKDFKWRHFEGAIILWAVRWYCKYGISYRELEEMLKERGVDVDHTTIYRWVQHYAPELQRRLKWYFKGTQGGSWRVDETYIKVKGHWKYLYRAVDAKGYTVDFYLSQTRNAAAAKRFLGKALYKKKEWELPHTINTDKAAAYGVAIQELKAEGKLPQDTLYRQVKYLNNIVESDHGKLKRLIKPTLGFKTMKTAYATIKGFEAMRSIKKGQGKAYCIQKGVMGEVRLVERCFQLGKSPIAELVEWFNAQTELINAA